MCYTTVVVVAQENAEITTHYAMALPPGSSKNCVHVFAQISAQVQHGQQQIEQSLSVK
jgi:hypothetical protein